MSENEDWTNNDSRRRMLAAKAALINKDYQKSIDPRFADTEFLIEADSYAQHMLWREYHECDPKDPFDRQDSESSDFKVKWKEDSSGMAFCVGKLLDRPVYIDCRWVKLNGHRVCFYTSNSQVVDWKMIEEWLNKVCYPIWDNGTRYAHTDAMNFHHCIDHVLTSKPKEKTHNDQIHF